MLAIKIRSTLACLRSYSSLTHLPLYIADELYIDRLANIIAFIDSNITHFET